MMFSCNRFAFVPHMCFKCKRYIWMEGYRKSEVWNKFIDRTIKQNICQGCLTQFDVLTEQKRRNTDD